MRTRYSVWRFGSLAMMAKAFNETRYSFDIRFDPALQWLFETLCFPADDMVADARPMR